MSRRAYDSTGRRDAQHRRRVCVWSCSHRRETHIFSGPPTDHRDRALHREICSRVYCVPRRGHPAKRKIETRPTNSHTCTNERSPDPRTHYTNALVFEISPMIREQFRCISRLLYYFGHARETLVENLPRKMIPFVSFYRNRNHNFSFLF